VKLTFWGAAQTVTGSMHEAAVNGHRYLLDCGMYQGRRKEARERNASFPWPGEAVTGVVLSHAHIDHSGNLPTFHKHGYTGPIYTSPATIDLCHSMLMDSAYLQEKDAEFLAKRRHRRRLVGHEDQTEAVEPLYSMKDAEATLPQFRPVLCHEPTEIGPGVSLETFDAGHMLGSTAVVLTVEEKKGRKLRLAFSGDVGRPNLPIVRDPEPLPPVDYLILESTYGNRLHQPVDSVANKLAEIVNRTAARGGRIVAPAFAVGRTQQLVLMLHELIEQERIVDLPIFVDSPLAIDVTRVFREHTELFDQETGGFLKRGKDPFGFSRLRYVRDVAESKALNGLRGPFMVISASGMCEAGRILHHLRNSIEDKRNTILITGFQGENTLGRKIVEKWPMVPIFGEPMELRAEVAKINELSGHADQRELLEWMKPLARGLKRVFLVHGETSQQAALKTAVESAYGVEVVIPARGESFQVD
jgi:metallo-beta-lactamase family protein